MAIQLKDLAFDVEATLEGKMLLVEKPKVYDGYREGVKIGPEGLAYKCLCEGLNYEKQVIKIKGSLDIPFEFNDSPIPVKFENLQGKVWQDWSNKGEIKLSVTADSVQVIKGKHIQIGGTEI